MRGKIIEIRDREYSAEYKDRFKKLVKQGLPAERYKGVVVQIGRLEITIEEDENFALEIGDFVEFTADRLDAEICPNGLLPYKE